MKAQLKAIREHLESGKAITPLQALNDYGCLRLAARIADLRNEGMAIKTEREKRNGKSFAKYIKA